ncbi:hypothetical protein XA68_16618 [Ophiocordyceps unilateralis]|uniref:Uncharacterized protein n=1 Tax=Ophiocordyceps unilateralis TaxID=268505 RepID=A0A2A9P5Y4_OPHUN|nr:hypothetical protein XA68_16618 [Ophiocordyceps unilateralis]
MKLFVTAIHLFAYLSLAQEQQQTPGIESRSKREVDYTTLPHLRSPRRSAFQTQCFRATCHSVNDCGRACRQCYKANGGDDLGHCY